MKHDANSILRERGPAALRTVFDAAVPLHSVGEGPQEDGFPIEDPDGAAAVSSDPQPRQRFTLHPFAEIKVDTTRRGYLVKNLLASSGLAVIWGPPKCGKSFWAVDLGLHISLGWEYRGRRVQQAPVVYVALEGQHGLPARIEAFRRHYGVTNTPFFLVTSRLNLIADAKQLVTDIRVQIPNGIMPGVVFVDTLNRSLVGSESKDEDMARYLAAAEFVESNLKCAVAIVHHCGIDASRPRGHTSLTGSVESQLAVKKGEDGEVIVTVEYAKDFAEGAEIISRLEQVTVGVDPDGDAITTLVVLPCDRKDERRHKAKVTGATALCLRILQDSLADGGDIPPANRHIPPGTRTFSEKIWRANCYAGMSNDDSTQTARQKAFVRASNRLQAANLIGKWEDHVWLA